VSDDAPKVVLCNDCKMWFDATLAQCPSCDHERPGVNVALKNAVQTERLNSALSRQTGFAAADKRAEQQFRSAANTGDASVANRPLNNYPGYSNLVGSIKQQLAESNFGT
jgi:hypothetical protein